MQIWYCFMGSEWRRNFYLSVTKVIYLSHTVIIYFNYLLFSITGEYYAEYYWYNGSNIEVKHTKTMRCCNIRKITTKTNDKSTLIDKRMT